MMQTYRPMILIGSTAATIARAQEHQTADNTAALHDMDEGGRRHQTPRLDRVNGTAEPWPDRTLCAQPHEVRILRQDPPVFHHLVDLFVHKPQIILAAAVKFIDFVCAKGPQAGTQRILLRNPG